MGDRVYALIEVLREETYSDFDIVDYLIEKFDLSENDAKKYVLEKTEEEWKN